ncbi:MAG: flavodoxin domain-containing protein [Dehalococcoidia bacterium]|nr:flavodoxin domain-containing protein [Dehalococcoidia bacterium]
MRVLVAWASKHGATAGIAEAIGEELREQGLEVTALPMENVGALEEFDAFVLGAAVYVGQWVKPAKEFVQRNREVLARRPVWLFSSGPIGEPLKPAADAVDVGAAMEATAAREHRLFAGRIARKELGLAEKAMMLALRVPDGDWRDWEDIRGWARGIAAKLAELPAPEKYRPWAVGGRW